MFNVSVVNATLTALMRSLSQLSNKTAQSQTATSRPVAQIRAQQTSLCLAERRAVSFTATRRLPRVQICSASNDAAACPRAQRPRPVAAARVAQLATKQKGATPRN